MSLSLQHRMGIKGEHWPYIGLGAGILSIGISGILVRWAEAPGPVTAFYRMAIATSVLAWPFFKRKKTYWKTFGGLPRQGLLIAILGGLLFGGDMAIWATGVKLSGATIPTLLGNTASVWVGLGALVLFQEKLKGMFWIGLALALSGAAVILGVENFQEISVDVGALLGLLSSLFYAGYFLTTQKGRESLDALSYLWIAVFAASVELLAVNVLLQNPLTGFSGQTYLSFLGLGLISQIAGWLSINYALGHLPATIVAPTLLGQPVVTAVLAAILLGESLTGVQFAGGIIVLTGVYLAHRSRNKIVEV